jgi:hypothetical protein
MSVSKIEFKVASNCTGSSIAWMTVGGEFRSPTFTHATSVLKITNIAQDMNICIGLQGTCNTIEKLCGGSNCWYALLDKPTGSNFEKSSDFSKFIGCCAVASV